MSGGRLELGVGAGAAATRGIGVLSGRPAHLPGVVDDLVRYRETAERPRVAACRIVEEGEPVGALLDRLERDPALPMAGELVLQTGPAMAAFGVHLDTLRAVATALAPAPARSSG